MNDYFFRTWGQSLPSGKDIFPHLALRAFLRIRPDPKFEVRPCHGNA